MINAYAQEGQPIVTGTLGTFGLQSAALSSGTLADGGVFAPGGTVTIVIPGISLSYSGTITSATWSKVTLANRTHAYTLTASANSGQGNCTFVLLTQNIGSGVWQGSAGVYSVNIALNLQ